jgi:DNA-binding winged helix-turn-helix (wHTH) protein/tetratricopeptide (TPR) repeat protein
MAAFRFDDYRLDTATRELTRGNSAVALPPRAFDALVLLIERRDRAVGREELIDAIWGARGASDVQLAQLMLQCRRAVGDDGQAQRAIKTVSGFGYRWVGAIADEIPAHAPRADSRHAPAHTVDETVRAAGVDSDAGHPLHDDSHATTFREEKSAPTSETPHPSSVRARAKRNIVVLVALFAAALAVVAVVMRPHDATEAPIATVADVLVAPVAIDDADARWLRLGGMDVIVQRLRGNRVRVLSSEETVALMRASSPDSSAQRAALAKRAGVAATIDVAATRVDGAWRVTATLHRDNAPPRSETIENADPLIALRGIADRMSGALGFPPAEPAPATGSAEIALTLQQARAALLANEPDRARELIEANPALVANEPLLQQQLADVDIRSGRYADAARTLDALIARDDLAPAFRAALQNSRGLVDIRTGRFAEAGADFERALALVGDDGDPVALGRAFLGRGISRTSLQDYAGAQADYAKAREAFERVGDPGSVARVDSDIGSLEILRGHMPQAETFLDRARERFAGFGMVQEDINVLQLLFVARRALLRNAEAADAIDGAWAMRARIVSPSSRLSVGLYRVESLLALGRLAEARVQLGTLGDASTAHAAANAEDERAALMRASLLHAEGRDDEALEALDGVSEAPHASADDDGVRASVGLLRARLERALHRPGDVTAEKDQALATPTPRTPLRQLAEANRAWARGDRDAADRAFAAALALADEQGIAETLVAVAGDDVAFLLESGRTADAAAVAMRIAAWADADYDAALATLRVAHAGRDRSAWSVALERARRLAGERVVPVALATPPD